ncbi:MAG: site-specific integrase [Lachnospiraceae bacterium]|nr:site-specific integrase [Lachnospiraceae bacterium]
MKTVQPIRDPKKITKMKTLLRARGEKYAIMFSLGINSGLRVSDVLNLKVGDVQGKDHITVKEKKTGKNKRFLLNSSLQKELNAYIASSGLSADEYLIQSRKGKNKPISRIQAYRILNEEGHSLNLDEVGTHTMRKTFGYHHYKKYHDVAMLQDIFNHSAPSITLRYIGITDDEKDKSMEDFYL